MIQVCLKDIINTTGVMLLYGYKILGSKNELLEVCKKVKPDMILISTSAIDQTSEDILKIQLAGLNISLGRFSMTLNTV